VSALRSQLSIFLYTDNTMAEEHIARPSDFTFFSVVCWSCAPLTGSCRCGGTGVRDMLHYIFKLVFQGEHRII